VLLVVTMIEDSQLIRQYAAERSEPAFAELVRRHLKMVYATGLRQVNGDIHLAEDVAQSVFADLARKAGKLQHHASIAGWLYTSTRFVAAKAIRAEARRRVREQAVASMNDMNSNPNAVWHELRPMIDESLDELRETDREAIVLRYFEAYEFSIVGTALGVSENAARMRVDRALEKLRVVLQKRGVATTGAALAGALAESSGAAVPVELAAGITSAAVSQAAALSVRSAPSILKLMVVKKLSLAAIGVIALSLAAVFVARNASDSNPQSGAANSPKAKQASPVELGGPAHYAAPRGDPDIVKKMARRQAEQARAREAQIAAERRAEWDKKVANFDDSLKEEPGVKKFGAKIQAAFGPGQTLVASGWRNPDGQNGLAFVTPKMNPELEGVGVNSNTVMIAPVLIDVPDDVLDHLGMAAFKAKASGANPPAMLSSEQADAMFNSITNTTDSDFLVSPRVVQGFGQEGNIFVGSVASISGKEQPLGLQISFFPDVSEDDGSLDVGMLIRYTVATAAEDTPAQGP
jgi:RNA polymerase sigma factor (sigma-70 family)